METIEYCKMKLIYSFCFARIITMLLLTAKAPKIRKGKTKITRFQKPEMSRWCVSMERPGIEIGMESGIEQEL
jgi:hypothetical protein